MSAGKIIATVTSEPIQTEEILNWNGSRAHGAANLFIGKVRNLNVGREVVSIEYDCFPALCERVFLEIAREAQEKWGRDSEILIIHRHGLLKVGEPSVLIYATTGHRDESYRITRYIIEEIKTRAPVWKKENYQDGESEWVRGHALCQHRKVDHSEIDGISSRGREVHPHGTR
jgi:molybdopterin synthase catalytic subunit